MDPLAVLKTLWTYKSVSLPVLFLTLFAAIYVFQFAPRSFESTASFAVINPRPPTDEEILKNPDLGKLNSDNPFLRSSDPSLVVQVVLTRLNDKASSDALESQHLSTDYTVSRGAGGFAGFILDVNGRGPTPEASFATTRALSEMLQKDLYEAQKLYGADDRFLFTSMVIAPAVKATEQFSSRLRSVIVVLLGGVVLMFGAVSVAPLLRSAPNRASRRTDRARKGTESPTPVATSPQRDSKAGTSPPTRLSTDIPENVIERERIPEASK